MRSLVPRQATFAPLAGWPQTGDRGRPGDRAGTVDDSASTDEGLDAELVDLGDAQHFRTALIGEPVGHFLATALAERFNGPVGPALVDAIERFDPVGRPVTTFGVAFVFQADRGKALSHEAGQPARWWPLDEPPERRSPHLWQRMFEYLTRTT